MNFNNDPKDIRVDQFTRYVSLWGTDGWERLRRIASWGPSSTTYLSEAKITSCECRHLPWILLSTLARITVSPCISVWMSFFVHYLTAIQELSHRPFQTSAILPQRKKRNMKHLQPYIKDLFEESFLLPYWNCSHTCKNIFSEAQLTDLVIHDTTTDGSRDDAAPYKTVWYTPGGGREGE